MRAARVTRTSHAPNYGARSFFSISRTPTSINGDADPRRAPSRVVCLSSACAWMVCEGFDDRNGAAAIARRALLFSGGRNSGRPCGLDDAARAYIYCLRARFTHKASHIFVPLAWSSARQPKAITTWHLCCSPYPFFVINPFLL